MFLVQYNPSQYKAIATITAAVVQAFPLPKLRLLQGPPGTGKTYTLKGLVKNILKVISSLLVFVTDAAVSQQLGISDCNLHALAEWYYLK